MVPTDPCRAPKKPRRVVATQCRTEIATCPVCAGQHYYYVRRILWVSGWFGGYCKSRAKSGSAATRATAPAPSSDTRHERATNAARFKNPSKFKD